MTNDRDKMTADRSVSATYRELADERAPASLDEKVLRRAAALPRARAGVGRAWMKPGAWAATIGLSLAIVLELTQIPQVPLDVDLLDVDRVAPPAPRDEHPVLAPASVEPAAAKESRSTKPSKHRSESGAVEESTTQAMSPAMAPARADAKVQADVPALESAQPQGLESADLQPLDDGDMTPDARSDEVAGTAAFAVRAKRMMLEQPALCPETVREVAEDWYRCIEAQGDEVPPARVAEEFEEFRKRFPDFQVSGTE
jgi:hypothetical protein